MNDESVLQSFHVILPPHLEILDQAMICLKMKNLKGYINTYYTYPLFFIAILIIFDINNNLFIKITFYFFKNLNLNSNF